MTTEEVRVRVAEAKQRDAGRGKARINDETMQALNIVADEIISIKGKKNHCSCGLASVPRRSKERYYSY